MKKRFLALFAVALAAALSLPALAFADDEVADLMPLATEPAGSGSQEEPSGTPMYRLYNLYSGEHFYTASWDEVENVRKAGWAYEGVGWYAPEKSKTPVYRLYNKYAGDHHYTTNATEKASLVKAGWADEGIGWYSDDEKKVPLYRQYNPYAWSGTHNYTTSKDENDSLVKVGWKAEGIGWYGVGEGLPLNGMTVGREYRRILSGFAFSGLDQFLQMWEMGYPGSESTLERVLAASCAMCDLFPIYSNDPNTPEDVVRTHSGDCYSGGKLLVEMLRNMGLTASLRYAADDDMSIYPKMIKFGAEHYNVDVIVDGKHYYVDGTPAGCFAYISDTTKPIKFYMREDGYWGSWM